MLKLVVIDGASTDGTLDVLRGLWRADPVLVSERDHGIYDALNKGIARATGDVVGFLHSDDLFADDSGARACRRSVRRSERWTRYMATCFM